MKEKSESYYEKESYRALEMVLEQTKGKEFAEVKKALKQAYPFGERKGRPYKVWNKAYNHALTCLKEDKIDWKSSQ